MSLSRHTRLALSSSSASLGSQGAGLDWVSAFVSFLVLELNLVGKMPDYEFTGLVCNIFVLSKTGISIMQGSCGQRFFRTDERNGFTCRKC